MNSFIPDFSDMGTQISTTSRCTRLSRCRRGRSIPGRYVLVGANELMKGKVLNNLKQPFFMVPKARSPSPYWSLFWCGDYSGGICRSYFSSTIVFTYRDYFRSTCVRDLVYEWYSGTARVVVDLCESNFTLYSSTADTVILDHRGSCDSSCWVIRFSR